MVDILAVITLIGLYYLGRERGLIQEITDIAAIIGGFLLSSHFAPVLIALLEQVKVGNNPLPQGIVSIMSYITVFAVGAFAILIIGSAIDIASKRTFADSINKALGGLTGFIKGIILFWLLTFIVLISPIKESAKIKFINTFYSSRYLIKATPYIYTVISPVMSRKQRELTEDFMRWWKKNQKKVLRD